MFLPQVCKVCQSYERAVAYLLPYIMKEEERTSFHERVPAKSYLLTVKGDIHEIGKNIVSGCTLVQ